MNMLDKEIYLVIDHWGDDHQCLGKFNQHLRSYKTLDNLKKAMKKLPGIPMYEPIYINLETMEIKSLGIFENI